ncbi:hypothetical protein BS47DRAFT_1387720 [Hydnum rufescens UP504]|uniref:PEBP-like protein n=1 Tax=Hydnum rufescens UP504 TaxID=1448309 RepID=A0A9P6BA60_9AGAM|nr:hypothetical protein BS47DRAFT_1387720 [Hydnum rufescens UP504]
MLAVRPPPPSGTGPHRYTALLDAQLVNFTAPSTPVPNPGVHLINLVSYISSAGLGTPLAGSYFTIGTATVNVSLTTAVDSAMFLASSTATRSGSSTVSGTSAGSSTIQKGSADLGKGVSIGGVL